MNDVYRFSRDHIEECSERTVLSCLDCKDCEAVYFGESKRTLEERTEEHTRAVRAAGTKRYETADHCWKYNHDFDWEDKKIMDYKAKTTTRK